MIKHIRLLSANQIFNGFMPISLVLIAASHILVRNTERACGLCSEIIFGSLANLVKSLSKYDH